MNSLWIPVLLSGLMALCACLANHRSALGDEVLLACTADYRSPIPPPLLHKARIPYVYVYLGMPLRADASGKRILDEKLRSSLEEFLKLYGENGIKVLLVSGFYARPPKGTEAVDANGRTLTIACLRHPDFLKAMVAEIQDLIRVFSAYPAFGGFLFDDGVHVRVDACYCEGCKRLFKEKHGLGPPPFEPYSGGPRVEPNDPHLLWDAFHRESYALYMRTQAQAATSASKNLLLATIPSDSFYFGRHLSLNVSPRETALSGDARLMRIDRIQMRDWHIFQSFPIPAVVGGGSGLRPFATGCHLTEPSPKIILHSDGPLIEAAGRQQFMSPAEIGRMLRTTIAEGANRIGFWNNARVISNYPEGFEAIGSVAAEAEKISELLQERKPFPARVGLLYSTVTEILQQPWRANTLERWRHLHAFEAMAYALTRKSVQFRIIFDDELDEAALSGVDVLILAGVSHLKRPVADRLEKAAAGKLKILKDSSSLEIKGAVLCEFDSDYWFNQQLRGYRQVRHLDHQAASIWQSVLPKIPLAEVQTVTVTSDACFAKLFLGKDGSLIIFVVNWDFLAESVARLTFNKTFRMRDEVTGRDLGEQASLEIKVAPAGWRVLRCQ